MGGAIPRCYPGIVPHLLLVFLILLLGTKALKFCNQGSRYACECDSCWEGFPFDGHTDWITVTTDGCQEVDEQEVRRKIAQWTNEECGTSLHCQLESPVSPSQVLIGHWSCRVGVGILRLLILTNNSDRPVGSTRESTTFPAVLLGSVLHAREHLLAIVLRAHLHSVLVTRRFPTPFSSTTSSTSTTVTTTTTAPSSTTVPLLSSTISPTTKSRPPTSTVAPSSTSFPSSEFPLGLCLAVLFFGIAGVFAILLACWGRIDWKRLTEGRWQRRVYKKVPNAIRVSRDERPRRGEGEGGHEDTAPTSFSFNSASELIRY